MPPPRKKTLHLIGVLNDKYVQCKRPSCLKRSFLVSGQGMPSPGVSSSICCSAAASHGCWLADLELHVADVTVELSVSYSDFGASLRSAEVGLAVETLKTAQMITEPEGLDDHGCSFSQRGVTECTDFLATH